MRKQAFSDEFELCLLMIVIRRSRCPRRGARVEVYLGYADQALTRVGRYTVDEVEVSGPRDTLVIRGKASGMPGSGKTVRSGSWEDVPLQEIVRAVAARNGWQPVCPVQTKVPRPIPGTEDGPAPQ